MSEEKQYTLKELKEKLTEKERIFCHKYIIQWNATQAAKEAGYSETSSRQIGSENLSKPYIQQYINYIKDDIEKECGISKMMVVNEVKKIVQSSIASLQKDWITKKEFNELPDYIKDCISELQTETKSIFSGNEDAPVKVEYVKVKLYDKLKAIEILNKMMGYNDPEKYNHSGEMNINWNEQKNYDSKPKANKGD